MNVIVGHGSTPTGVGLAYTPSGLSVRATSPCCGEFFENRGPVYVKARAIRESISAFCLGCSKDYTELMFECGGTLYPDFEVGDLPTMSHWVAQVFGFSPFDVTVEVTAE